LIQQRAAPAARFFISENCKALLTRQRITAKIRHGKT
jgi:hypothetical protein